MATNPGFGGMAPVIPQHGATVSYEFSPHENEALTRVGGRARTCGVISLVTGVLGLLASVGMVVVLAIGATSDAGGVAAAVPVIVLSTILPISLVSLIVGSSYMKAGASLRDVTTTQGNDVKHMMASLERFKTAFRLETIVAASAMVVGFVIGIVLRSMQ